MKRPTLELAVIVVIGKILNRFGTVRSVALQVFTNPADIQKILAQDSKTRSGGNGREIFSDEIPNPRSRSERFIGGASGACLRPLRSG
jgi:hypothetical protein